MTIIFRAKLSNYGDQFYKKKKLMKNENQFYRIIIFYYKLYRKSLKNLEINGPHSLYLTLPLIFYDKLSNGDRYNSAYISFLYFKYDG